MMNAWPSDGGFDPLPDWMRLGNLPALLDVANSRGGDVAIAANVCGDAHGDLCMFLVCQWSALSHKQAT